MYWKIDCIVDWFELFFGFIWLVGLEYILFWDSDLVIFDENELLKNKLLIWESNGGLKVLVYKLFIEVFIFF